MDLLTGNIRTLYFKFLSAAFGSALISCIYGMVDMAMVGQYQGPDGAAALAVVAPVWNIIYSLGLLTGIGGSVLFSARRGGGHAQGEDNQYFTAAVVGSGILAVLSWAWILLFEREVLLFFGADETLLPLAQAYLAPVRCVFPVFLLGQLVTSFLRNDARPGLATAAVLTGGIFNVFGDWFCVFVLDLGVFGAGLATATGAVISLAVMCSHFFSRKCTLHLVPVQKLFKKLGEIAVTGFSSFFVDVAMGILTVLFNRQIMKYLDSDALAVYATVINISTFVQCCAYSVGQAAQPILSTNYGANNAARIRQALHLALGTSMLFATFWTGLSELFPQLYIHIFMRPSAEILAIAPAIIRRYSVSFVLLPVNIFSTYYFQSILRPKDSFIVSIARGLLVSGLLIFALPALFAPEAIWWAMPLTELVTSVYAAYAMRKSLTGLCAN